MDKKEKKKPILPDILKERKKCNMIEEMQQYQCLSAFTIRFGLKNYQDFFFGVFIERNLFTNGING